VGVGRRLEFDLKAHSYGVVPSTGDFL